MDKIQRFIFDTANVRGEIVRLSDSFQTIIKQHQYPPTISHLLGQVLAVSVLLSAIIKFKGRLTVQFQGKNPLKLVLAQCNNAFEIRGLVQWQGDLSEQELLAALKQGILGIIISSDASTTPYQGVVAWKGDSIAESIEGYFENSEQLPTRIWLAVNETTATGILLQPLPKAGAQQDGPIIGDNDWERIVYLTETLTPEEMLTLDNATLLHRLYSQEDVRVFDAEPVTFRCSCSTERGENAILMLGQKDAEAELKANQKIVVTCEFCNTAYAFDSATVAGIFEKNQ